MFSALALFLMVADARFQITGPFRQAVATVLYPVQWLMLQPVEFASHGRSYFQSLQTAQEDLDAARKKMTVMGQRANQADQLAMENQRLRKLLELRDRLQTLPRRPKSSTTPQTPTRAVWCWTGGSWAAWSWALR